MDGDYGKTMAGEQALMESLAALSKAEAEIQHLKTQVSELTAEVTKLREGAGVSGQDKQIKELLRVNHMWDEEYQKQEKAFEQYRIDSQLAQQENQAYIAKLKEEKDALSHEVTILTRQPSRGSHGDSQQEVEVLKRESAQKDKIIGGLKQKNRVLEEQVRHGAGVDPRRLRQLEEEVTLLKQQVTAYKEDFEAEQRDKERLVEEKRSVSLRYEAELTSLKLQLDRCRNELHHYSTEATRLGQQLRLKQQCEEDQFKKHLESRGYVSRGSNGLPPLDPFVEQDPPSHTRPTLIEPPQTNVSPKPLPRKAVPQRRENYGNQLLARSSDSEDSNPSSAPASIGRDQYYKPDVNRTSSPSPTHLRRQQAPPSPSRMNGYHQNGYPERRGYMEPSVSRASSNPTPNGYPEPSHLASNHSNGYIMHNGGIVNGGTTKLRRVEVDSSDAFVEIDIPSNAHPFSAVPQRVNSDGQLNRHSVSPTPENLTEGQRSARNQAREPEVLKIPPMQTKGRHKCPRCARRFQHSSDYEDHKARCIS